MKRGTMIKEFFELCQAAKCDYIAVPPDVQQKVVEFNHTISRVSDSQYKLLQALEQVSDEQVTQPEFAKIISNLGWLVAQVESAVSETYAAPDFVATLVRKNLESVAGQNSHLDSYVESFRVAFDENCSALLANLATKVIAG